MRHSIPVLGLLAASVLAFVLAGVPAVAAPHGGGAVSTGGDAESKAPEAAAPAASQGGHAEASGVEGEEAVGIGYIGLSGTTSIPKEELERWEEGVREEAYRKGALDQVRLVIFALSFAAVFVAFARIKALEPFSRVLRNGVDWHTLGTVTGLLLVGLVIPSGIIITFFYMPTSKEAYGSVQIMTARPVLAFFRNLHNWSSEVFMWLMVLHAARTVSTRSFLGKRKFIWLSGAVAAAVGWVAFLSGTFMRGDQEALEGFAHMMYSFTLVPLGKYVADFFSGELTLVRLTALHVIATLFIIAVFLTMHVLMRKVHVFVVQRWKKAVVYSVAFTVFLVVQSLLMEAPFVRGLSSGPTVAGIEATKPPWPIYFLIQGENWFGANAMVAILSVVFVPFILLPYVVELLPVPADRKARVGEIVFYGGTFVLIAVSYMAAAGTIQAHITG